MPACVVVALGAASAAAALEDYGCLSFAIFENSTKLSVVLTIHMLVCVQVKQFICLELPHTAFSGTT